MKKRHRMFGVRESGLGLGHHDHDSGCGDFVVMEPKSRRTGLLHLSRRFIHNTYVSETVLRKRAGKFIYGILTH
jgi:hypothetical protein